ncbi:MAG: DUF456 domain-containing protein [Lentimicrobiaceae bacterium]|nr:DUF456 domain-containing protein [Lentimicrobiaceae bacterium]
MDWIWIVSGAVMVLIGIAGAIVPVLPGPPLAYLGVLLLQLTEKAPFSERFLINWAVVTILVTVLDYVVPVWGTKRYGGSKKGVWGSTLGLIAGLVFFPPVGIIIGPFIGALVGELIEGKTRDQAIRAAFGSFIGFLAGTFMKLAVSLILAYHFVAALI